MGPQPPPMWQHLLFESPWLLVIGIVAVGAVLRVIGRQRGQKAMAAAWWIAVALALLIVAMAKFVTTGREQLLAISDDLISATAPIEPRNVIDLLTVDAVLVGPNGETWMRFDQVRDELDRVAQAHPIQSQSIQAIEAEARSDTEGLVAISLRTVLSEGMGAQVPIPSKWLLTWRKTPQGWRLGRIQAIEMMNQEAQFGAWR